MTIDVLPDGTIALLYTDELPLRELGTLSIDRASNVEFDPARQEWTVGVPGASEPLFHHHSRQACLDWEHENDHAILDHHHARSRGHTAAAARVPAPATVGPEAGGSVSE